MCDSKIGSNTMATGNSAISDLTNISSVSQNNNESYPLRTNEQNEGLGHFEEDEELKWKRKRELLKKIRHERDELRKQREQEELEIKKKQALKSMNYLLTKSMKYSHFFKNKLQQHMDSKVTGQKGGKPEKINSNPNFANMLRPCMFEDTEDFAATKTEIQEVDIMDQLNLFNGVLKPYQVEGLIWLTILFENGVNGILADEMGLGKTVQVIALLCHLYERKIEGPFLVIAPLSTIPNWAAEFKRFAPEIPVITLQGDRQERLDLQRMANTAKYRINDRHVQPVILTAYHTPLMEPRFFSQFRWQYIIVDEGHRIKNHQSKLSVLLRQLKSTNKLILTGTPLQNNLTELWALLNFLLPHIFSDIDTFASLLMIEDIGDDNKIVKEEQSTSVISTIHKVLAPFMLRRLKCDVLLDMVPKKEVLVYCPLTKIQRDIYMYIIQKNVVKLKGLEEDDENCDPFTTKRKRKCTSDVRYKQPSLQDYLQMEEDFLKKEENSIGVLMDKKTAPFIYRLTMQNPMMMFKKVVDHPFLIHFPLNPNSKVKELLVDEQLVEQSGKMLVLDAMLAKLKPRGHKVLIFSTLTMLLDLIEDYLIMRNYQYRRLDGSQRLEQRGKNIGDFNGDPNVFVFLLSTRAGGLGLNLTAADTVIFYDRDWNPQSDIQAQDRCHRIGQTKPVVVYSLVTKNTIDERIINTGNIKRRLEKLIIQDGKFKSIKDDEKEKLESDFKQLKELLEQSDCSTKIHSNGYVFSDKELNDLLDRRELYNEMKKRVNK